MTKVTPLYPLIIEGTLPVKKGETQPYRLGVRIQTPYPVLVSNGACLHWQELAVLDPHGTGTCTLPDTYSIDLLHRQGDYRIPMPQAILEDTKPYRESGALTYRNRWFFALEGTLKLGASETGSQLTWTHRDTPVAEDVQDWLNPNLKAKIYGLVLRQRKFIRKAAAAKIKDCMAGRLAQAKKDLKDNEAVAKVIWRSL